MHTIEPFFLWRDDYTASEDEKSPFYGKQYSEFFFDKKIYNYLLHPQWEDIGSETIFIKALFVDYDLHYAIIECIGEWNDTLNNDIETLLLNVLQPMMAEGIHSFVFLMEAVYNFHGSDDLYYEELAENLDEKEGFICFVNLLEPVQSEMEAHDIHKHVYMGAKLNHIAWRPQKPYHLYLHIKNITNQMDGIVDFLEF
jgi:hypothetical protein